VAYNSNAFSSLALWRAKKKNGGWLSGAPIFSGGGGEACFRLATAAKFGG